MIRVTRHAIERYRQRVEPMSDAKIVAILTSPVFDMADRFGVPIVKLGTGQRAVLRDHAVITILPAGHHPACLDPQRTSQSGKE